MKHYLYPDACADSAYDIPYQKMYDLGYRGIIYDIDNTLVPFLQKKASEQGI